MDMIGCVATYDDIDLLPGCIDSLRDMDKIVVVDGAIAGEADDGPSTDGTLDYLKKLAAEDRRVELVQCEKPWPSLIEKRNAYLVGGDGDWYFVLEAFERAYGLSELKWFLDQATSDVFSVQHLAQPWAEQPVLVQRLFKHLTGIHYEGAPDRVVCGEKALVDPAQPAAYLTDQDPLISPRIVSVMHKRLRAKAGSPRE